MTSQDSKIKNVHAKLLTEINDTVVQDADSVEYQNLRQMFLSLDGIKKGNLSKCKNLLEMLQLIGTRGHLAPGNYRQLRTTMSESGNQDVVNLIDDAECKIKELKAPLTPASSVQVAAVPASAVQPVQPSAPTITYPTQVSESDQTRPSTSVQNINGNNKRKFVEIDEEVDESDPLSITVNGQSCYNYKPNKKGYLLILEQRENRAGSHYDTTNLKKFFRDQLFFEVNDPRSQQEFDFTETEFNDILDATKNRLNDIYAKEYYCFICVILSHGDMRGLAMKDGPTKSTEEIRKNFTNDKIPAFTGKPKVFLIQACRGHDIQQGESVDEDDDVGKQKVEENDDEADEIICLPHDADTLLAFSTTPGYKSFRRTKSTSDFVGSWFIQKCLEVFEENHKEGGSRHLEDMLISVRDRVAKIKTGSGGMQMPCVWSTLTKRLLLRQSN